MKSKDNGRLACPRAAAGEGEHVDELGMTLRQWYAGQALAGAMASVWGDNHTDEQIAAICITQADALIAELDKDKE